ncbi:Uncharacterised protein [Nocardia otitidiscaviarum]|uniref:Uncharacterized protein n=1 Tax=Nocardia otitidiscaviarum TaxID=1823 RepID=A0A378Y8H2_9NOCA|nr:hypothetical protein [Nocardia otitidiscaviarum]MBF6177879.1 hypothetical protein [Nocardia otitidiscaviarum]MBF6241571.1 hypothetical protein [Nocardia otitidiscaviarum]MCP9625410.1 hypothetical protein [Nocardia otitidiscaviarum]QDP78084.1 hypothetical protein FOH10_04370 [Nocardia otitidiscaviarum]SUA72801.1 Uncharacterised protein [Nocardia otitidiscaviarum]
MALNADPDVLIPAARNAMALQGNHEGYLKALLGVQDELAAAIVSPGAGAAVREAMTNAHTKGHDLAVKLQEIIQTLQDTGIRIDASDMDAAAQVRNATSLGTNGAVDVPAPSGTSPVNTNF